MKQKTLTDIFIKGNAGPVKSNTKDAKFLLARRMSLWFCRSLLPFSTGDCVGFKDFWKVFRPNDEIPSRKTISNEALDDLYICMKNQLIKVLESAPKRGFITFDAWTDSFKKSSYVTYTYHYMSYDWCMESTVLKTMYFDRPHTGQALSENFQKVLKEFKIENKCISVVTDGGSNVILCSNLLNLHRFGCIAHSCNRLIQHDLLESKDPDIKKINEVIAKLRKTQRALMYRHSELHKMHENDKHMKLYQMLEEFCETEGVWTSEEQFCQELQENNNDNFNGLTAISRVRWNCLLKTTRCHLNHQSE